MFLIDFSARNGVIMRKAFSHYEEATSMLKDIEIKIEQAHTKLEKSFSVKRRPCKSMEGGRIDES